MAQGTSLSVFPLLSVNVGTVKPGIYKGKETRSGIEKTPVEGIVALTDLRLCGDEQGDLVNHGGEDKAVCVYSFDHYPHWEKVLNRKLPYGSFGENFTVRNLHETDVCIGDLFQVGSAVVQISQPRQPCWKLAMRWGLDQLPMLVTEAGATGFYFRVVETGELKSGDELRLIERHPGRVTVAEANRVMHKDKQDFEALHRLLSVNELSTNWKVTLDKRLSKRHNQ